MSNEHCIEGGTEEHADYGQPCVGHIVGWGSAIPNAEHVRDGLKQRPSVLLSNGGILQDTQVVQTCWYQVPKHLGHRIRPRGIATTFKHFDRLNRSASPPGKLPHYSMMQYVRNTCTT